LRGAPDGNDSQPGPDRADDADARSWIVMVLDNWLEQRATSCPDRAAVATAAGELTYAALEEEAKRCARRLAARGVRAGSLVAIELPVVLEHAVLLHALMKLGAIAAPISTRLAPPEREAELERVAPALIVTRASELDGPEADMPLLGEHDLDAVHCRMATSGTSGRPKAVGITYGNHLWSAVGSAFNLGVDPADRWLCCLPLHHVGGLSILIRSAIYGTTAILHDGFEAEAVAASLDSDRATLVSLVPTQLERLLAIDAELSGPRAILLGGGPASQEMLEEASGRGARIVPTYGLTEAASQVTTLAPADVRRRLGSAGRPLLTTRLRIVGGEILVQGPTVAPGCADEDGWLHTGDLGRIDEEGFLYVVGRIDDLIVTGGENVVPDEVEAVLLSHPAVADAAVIGRADEEWGEAVAAVVVPAGAAPPSPDDLRLHCAASLAGYKVPKRFEFTAELPRTGSGKLLRRALRAATASTPRGEAVE
jgi:O-succinylbenzoic acid--CoA ligase